MTSLLSHKDSPETQAVGVSGSPTQLLSAAHNIRPKGKPHFLLRSSHTFRERTLPSYVLCPGSQLFLRSRRLGPHPPLTAQGQSTPGPAWGCPALTQIYRLGCLPTARMPESHSLRRGQVPPLEKDCSFPVTPDPPPRLLSFTPCALARVLVACGRFQVKQSWEGRASAPAWARPGHCRVTRTTQRGGPVLGVPSRRQAQLPGAQTALSATDHQVRGPAGAFMAITPHKEGPHQTSLALGCGSARNGSNVERLDPGVFPARGPGRNLGEAEK